MRRSNQFFEHFGAAVVRVRREGENPVVAPIARARCRRERHEFNGRYADVRECVKALYDAFIGAARREGADVKFIQHALFPGWFYPISIGPSERAWIDDF